MMLEHQSDIDIEVAFVPIFQLHKNSVIVGQSNIFFRSDVSPVSVHQKTESIPFYSPAFS